MFGRSEIKELKKQNEQLQVRVNNLESQLEDMRKLVMDFDSTLECVVKDIDTLLNN